LPSIPKCGPLKSLLLSLIRVGGIQKKTKYT